MRITQKLLWEGASRVAGLPAGVTGPSEGSSISLPKGRVTIHPLQVPGGILHSDWLVLDVQKHA